MEDTGFHHTLGIFFNTSVNPISKQLEAKKKGVYATFYFAVCNSIAKTQLHHVLCPDKTENCTPPILTDTLNQDPLQPTDVDLIQQPSRKKSRIGAILISESLPLSCFLRVQRLVFCGHLYRFCKKLYPTVRNR